MKWMRSVVAMAFVFVVVPVNVAGAGQVGGEELAVRPVVDPVSGIELRVHRAAPGDAVFEVVGERLTVHKAITSASSKTVLTTDEERVTVEVSREGVRLEDAEGVVVARAGDLVAGHRVRARLAESPAVRAALALLTEVGGGARSPVTQALLATRVTLGALAGDPIVRGRLLRAAAERPRTRLVSIGQENGPGECWDQYAEEAIEAYMEYEDCVDNTNWYDVAGLAACLTVYELRAIGAFSWWLSCVAIRA